MRHSSPFGLGQYLRAPSLRLDWVPVVDILLVLICLSLLGSKYIFPLGLEVSLPVQGEGLRGVQTQSVLTMVNSDMILYEGARFSLDSFTHYMSSAKMSLKDGVILLRLNKDVDMQSFVKVCEAVKRGGYTSVQVAASMEREKVELLHYQ